MKVTVGIGFTLLLGPRQNSNNEYIRPSVTYTDIDLDGDVEAQLAEAREATKKILDEAVDITLERVNLLSGQNLTPDLMKVFYQIDGKLQELENGLIEVAGRIPAKKVRQKAES